MEGSSAVASGSWLTNTIFSYAGVLYHVALYWTTSVESDAVSTLTISNL